MFLPGQGGVAGVSATPKKCLRCPFISEHISPRYWVGSPENTLPLLPGRDVGAKSLGRGNPNKKQTNKKLESWRRRYWATAAVQIIMVLRTLNAMSTLIDSCDMNDARPLRTVQGGAASGSVPQRSPPSATGSPTRPPCHARGRGRTATGSTPTSTRTHRLFQVTSHALECIESPKQKDRTGAYPAREEHQRLLHPGGQPTEQQTL